MTPLEFLAVVLPSPDNGLYCAAELTTKKKEHNFVQYLDELPATITKWGDSKDIYFALSTFETKGKRTADNARYIRSLFIDMDGYETKKAAAMALNGFMVKTGLDLLGTPYIVDSGGGLHCYWPFTQDIAVDEWKPVAENLKRLCKQEALSIDMTVTADSARVLRFPGTFNNKAKYATPRPVRILAAGDTFDFEDLAKHIEQQLVSLPALPRPSAVAPLALPGQRPDAPHTPTTVKLFENSITLFKNIYKKTKNGAGCKQLEWYVENADQDGVEPLWRGWLSIAQKCNDGEKAAIWLTDLHPYPHERMHQKLAEIRGPYPCTKFDSENPGICDGCQFFGKVTNPLALGRETAVVTAETTIELPATDGQDARQLKRPEAPRGYAYGVRGGVFMEKEDTDANGQVTKRQIMLLPYDLFPVDILSSNGEHLVHMLAVRDYKTVDISFPQKSVVSKDETVKALAQQNVLAAFGSGNDKNLYDYIRACVEKMSSEKRPIEVPSSYGWQPNDTYVFGGKIYAAGKEAIEVPMPGLENITMNSRPTGSLEVWRQFINLLVRRKLWDHLAIILMGAGSPLMRFTGLHGLTVHCASTESGTGKSLALDGAASIWGHPIHYRTGAGTSPVAMQQRLGLLHSNPLITDEITSKNRDDFEWFPAFLFSMSEGRGKERMESGANKERLNLSTWSSTAIMSSNTHVVDYLTGSRKHSSEGELRRLIEYVLDEKLELDADEIEIVKGLQNNYAVAGEALVQYMVDNIDLLKTLVPETVRRMYTEYRAPNDERFWMGGIGCAIAAGIIMNSTHATIAEFPLTEIIDSFRKRITIQRSSIKGGHRSAEDVLNAFVQEYQGKFVVVKYGDKAGPLAHLGDGSMVDKHTTRAEVMGRVEHGVTAGHVDFFIEERMLKSFCSNMSFGYTNFKRQLEDEFTVSYVTKKDMMAKTSAPPMRVSAMHISRKVTESDEALINHVPVEQS
jgi:hypothetical protein